MVDAPPAIVEVYYDSRCAPCRRELPALAEAAGDAALPFSIIMLGNENDVRLQLAEASPLLPPRAKSIGNRDQRGVLQDAGNSEGILPYARAVKLDGRVCARWRGILSVERIRALLKACK